MPIAALLDDPATYNAAATGTLAGHAWDMEQYFLASAPGEGWTVQIYDRSQSRTGTAVAAALADGCKILFGGFDVVNLQGLAAAADAAGAVLIGAVGNGYDEVFSAPDLVWPVVATTVGTAAAGNRYTGYSTGVWCCTETHDLSVLAQSFGVAARAAILTRYPEAATNPQAALIRMLAGEVPVAGAARWTMQEGFGVTRTFVPSFTAAADPAEHALVLGSAANYSTAPGTSTATIAGGRRYAGTARSGLCAYSTYTLPPNAQGAGISAVIEADAVNHGAYPVLICSNRGDAQEVPPGQAVRVSLAYESRAEATTVSLRIEDVENRPFDVSLSNATMRDVRPFTLAVPPLASAGGALAPVLTVEETPSPGKFVASWVRLGGQGASLRVAGQEVAALVGTTWPIYLGAGPQQIEVRTIVPGGGYTESHPLSVAIVDGGVGYVPPVPALEVQRTIYGLLVDAQAEGATEYVVTAQAGAEPPAWVNGGEIEWPLHLPARIRAVAVGAGGESEESATLVPAMGASAALAENHLHPLILP
ncbi:MAG: hypothetical protein IAE99_08190 [Rhodothermales bacterium]|nr:hypothetical protein [Rhodothermales bacterium]